MYIISETGVIGIIRKILSRIRNASTFIPLVIFLGLVFLYIFTSYLTQFRPIIDSIEPEIGQPGDILVIRGRHFGNPAESENSSRITIKPVAASVYIAYDRLVLSDYINWENNKISLRIPANVSSGPVFVESRRGKSNQVVFINQKEIPTVLSGPIVPGHPHIASFEPTAASVSDIITITGSNFGVEKGNSQVFFTLAAANRAETEDSFIAASSVDFDYISWTNNEIRLRVPDGASSGRAWVSVNGINSNSFYFERVDIVGARTFGERRGFKVSYDVVLSVNEASGENSISFWVPMLSSSAEQRNIEYERNLVPNLDNFSNMMLYQFNNLRSRDTRTISITAWLERYEVLTRINRERVTWDYARDTQFFRENTAGDLFGIRTNDPRLDNIFREVVRGRDPYTTAESIFNIIVRNVNHTQNPTGTDVIDNYINRSGDSYTYAMMFTALARRAGIPARPVAGFLVYDNNTRVVRHFWSEFYIRRFGWVPVDPVLGAGVTFHNMQQVENPRTYYFGNLGSGHIAFSRGILSVPVMSPAGRTVFKDRMYSLQTSYEEVSGNINSYRTWWNELKILEWW
ncbi:MAG: IPT/TIG domain-containing protein [Spirochaetaceae bacterium]|nr:IPT/TIG domain-containing protein [Spirochaetaceae bacterium]